MFDLSIYLKLLTYLHNVMHYNADTWQADWILYEFLRVCVSNKMVTDYTLTVSILNLMYCVIMAIPNYMLNSAFMDNILSIF